MHHVAVCDPAEPLLCSTRRSTHQHVARFFGCKAAGSLLPGKSRQRRAAGVMADGSSSFDGVANMDTDAGVMPGSSSQLDGSANMDTNAEEVAAHSPAVDCRCTVDSSPHNCNTVPPPVGAPDATSAKTAPEPTVATAAVTCDAVVPTPPVSPSVVQRLNVQLRTPPNYVADVVRKTGDDTYVVQLHGLPGFAHIQCFVQHVRKVSCFPRITRKCCSCKYPV